MKKSFFFLLLPVYIPLCFANYDILLENNTSHAFIIDTGALVHVNKSAHGGLHNQVIKPYERKKVQWINYNRHIKKDHQYVFFIKLYIQDDLTQPLLQFHTQIIGHFLGSTIDKMSVISKNKKYVLKEAPSSPHDAEVFSRQIPSPLQPHELFTIRAASIKYSNPNPHYDLQSIDALTYVIKQKDAHFKASHHQDELTLLTYNTQIWPPFAKAGGLILNHPQRRLFHIAGHTLYYDVVAYEEVFDNTMRGELIDTLLTQYPYHVNPANNGHIFNSGISLHSRYPITFNDSYIFEHCAGLDCGAAKGVSYARVQKGERTYHIFATHLDATEKTVRRRQLVELKQYIRHFHIPNKDAVIVMGDLNIDSYTCLTSKKHCDEFETLLEYLSSEYHAQDNFKILPYTFSSQLDWMVTEKGKNEALDYILPIKGYRAVKEFHSRVRVMRADNDAYMYTGTPYGDTDLSDHFALEAKINY